MSDIKKPVFSLNVVGPMGDDTQEFQVGQNTEGTVSVKIGTVILRDGKGALFINGKGTYTSDEIDKIATDTYSHAKNYTDEAISTITSFEIKIVDQLPEVGEKGYLYFVPKNADSSGDSSEESTGYYEWIYVDGNWEEVGDTDFDIADYYTSAEIDQMFMPKAGGTFTGDVTVQGDITAQKIKLGNATITLYVDPNTQETTITINGGTIYLTGDVNVNGTIYQTNGDIIQYKNNINQ